MTAWSELPFGVLVWFMGIIALAAMWIQWQQSWHELGQPSRSFSTVDGQIALTHSKG